MPPIYILFICAGAVLLVLFMTFMIVNIETWKHNSQTKKNIHAAYNDKNLAKMEYDFAFYDGDLYGHAQQVTIDDVFSGSTENGEHVDELSRFKPIKETRDDVVVGNYDPESSSD